MTTLAYLMPVALFLGGLSLVAFLWALRSGQYEDLDGAAERIFIDESDNQASEETALVFTSGFSSNETSISTIEGVRRSGAEKTIFRHNDVAHVESLLRPELIAFESVYSMDSDIAPIKEIAASQKNTTR